MTREEAIKMAKADLKCMERDTSGQDEMCNSHKCDECSLNYERGNIGEQKEWLRLAIKALEQEPTTKNDLGDDAVRRKAVLNTLDNMDSALDDEDRTVETYKELLKECYKVLPSVAPQESILDKIRAEMFEEMLSHSGTGEEVIQAYGSGLKKGLYILDKYKAESEDKA